MKKLSPFIFLLCVACVGFDNFGCMAPSEYDRNTAQGYYDTFGTSLVSSTKHNQIRKKFGCYYRAGDKIYAYSTFWDNKYILVRHGSAITYVEGK